MSDKKLIRLNGFKQATVGHAAVGTWRHPSNNSHRYKELQYWLETARTLEEGMFDGLFIADVLGVLDTFEGSIAETLKQGVQTPSIDPVMVISAMAAVTQHLNFAVTLSTTYEQPYALARKLTTLDHLTDGRIGWNIVTSALDSAARNLGLDRQIPHAERYKIVEEFLEVTYKLWEASWADDAVKRDKEAGIFADPERVHPVRHEGKYFKVPDAFLAEPSPQRTPVLFQAGSSERGRDFAAKHAEGIFISVHRPDIAKSIVSDLRRRAALHGRDPQSLKIFAMATVVTDADDDRAKAKADDLRSYISTQGHIARLSAILQIDLSKLDPDTELQSVETDGIRGVLDLYTKLDPTTRWTPRKIGEYLGIAGGGAQIVGGPKSTADQLEHWFDEADIDGFNITDPAPLSTYKDFNEFVLPELRARGRVRTKYDGLTYRENLYGPGQSRLKTDHPGHVYKLTETEHKG